MRISIVALILVLLAIPASGELIATQPASIYNLNDDLIVSYTLIPTVSTSSFLNVELVCDDERSIIYKSPYTIAAGAQKTVPIAFTLSSTILGDLRGQCALEATFGEEHATTNPFMISDSLDISVVMEDIYVRAGSQLQFHGTARKYPYKPIDGFAEVSIPTLNYSSTQLVRNGTFVIAIGISPKAPAKTHKGTITIYEKDEAGNIGNQADQSFEFSVRQVLTSMDITAKESIST